MAEHAVRDHGIGLHVGIRDAVEIEVAERHEGIGDEARMRRAGRIVGMRPGEAAEIFERAQLVLVDAVAVGIDAAELPHRARHALPGGIFERGDALVDAAFAQQLGAGAESIERRRRLQLRAGAQRRAWRHRRPSAIGAARLTAAVGRGSGVVTGASSGVRVPSKLAAGDRPRASADKAETG